MKMLYVFCVLFNLAWAMYAWKITKNDDAFIIIHIYMAALFVMGYVEFSK